MNDAVIFIFLLNTFFTAWVFYKIGHRKGYALAEIKERMIHKVFWSETVNLFCKMLYPDEPHHKALAQVMYDIDNDVLPIARQKLKHLFPEGLEYK